MMRSMKITWMIVLIFSITIIEVNAEDQNRPTLKEASIQKQISYALGLDIAEKLKQNVDLDLVFFMKGAADALAGMSQFSEEDLKQLLISYQRLARTRQIGKIQIESKENRQLAATFLADNKTKEKVVTLASGLQYIILEQGEGRHPDILDTVECHYQGTLLDGTLFDSSYKRGEPAVFKVENVIPGWKEALQKMMPGSRWMLFVPSDLAYGDRGASDLIRPGMTLIFEVHLLKIME